MSLYHSANSATVKDTDTLGLGVALLVHCSWPGQLPGKSPAVCCQARAPWQPKDGTPRPKNDTPLGSGEPAAFSASCTFGFFLSATQAAVTDDGHNKASQVKSSISFLFLFRETLKMEYKTQFLGHRPGPNMAQVIWPRDSHKYLYDCVDGVGRFPQRRHSGN